MRMTLKLSFALASFAVLFLAPAASALAQYYYPNPYAPPPPPPPRYYGPPPPDYGYDYGPPRYRTWNGCPPGFTIQGGACRPYRGY